MVLLLLAGVVSSCTQINDLQISAFEKSIDKLEQNYQNDSPDKLQHRLELCEKQLAKLKEDTSRYTESQRQRISNLSGRYHRLLVKIKIHTATQEISEGASEAVEYIKGLLGAKTATKMDINGNGMHEMQDESVPFDEDDTLEITVGSVNDNNK